MKPVNCYWIQNTEATLARLRRASRGVALLPLASIESHGPHLPLGSDVFGIEYVLRLTCAREPAAILPVVQYSYVADARMCPGAIHIRTDILEELVEQICDETARNGFRKIVLVHGHGGNVTLGAGFLRRILEREKAYAVYSVPVFAGKEADILALLETKEWGHACEMETSFDLAACPELVDLQTLGSRTFPTQPAPDVGQAQTPVDWTARHPWMAVGIPQKATRAKGQKIARYWAAGLAEHIRKIKQDSRTPAAIASYNRRSHAL
jgi:creatinine amidohydrolase